MGIFTAHVQKNIESQKQLIVQIRQATDLLNARKAQLEARAARLEEERPALCAAAALGEIEDTALAEVRRELLQIRFELEDIALAHEGLKKRDAAGHVAVSIRRTNRTLEDARTAEDILDEISKGDLAKVDRARSLCRSFGAEALLDEILENLEPPEAA